MQNFALPIMWLWKHDDLDLMRFLPFPAHVPPEGLVLVAFVPLRGILSELVTHFLVIMEANAVKMKTTFLIRSIKQCSFKDSLPLMVTQNYGSNKGWLVLEYLPPLPVFPLLNQTNSGCFFFFFFHPYQFFHSNCSLLPSLACRRSQFVISKVLLLSRRKKKQSVNVLLS